MSACCGPSRESNNSQSSVSSASSAAQEGADAGALTMVEVPAGTFTMGTDDPLGYPDDGEGPEHIVELPGFAISATTVTNAQFAQFVEATGYVTTAQQFGDSFVFGGLLPDDFPPTRGVAAAPWWRQVEGADWQHPEGPHSDVDDRATHPVVHVSWDDALAYCAWSCTRLPTEAEWERAARGGRDGDHFPWGAEREPGGEHRMNVFQGQFPGGNTGADGWVGTCPVGSFPPNGFGLYETTGNVWEWCADWFDPSYYARSPRRSPRGPDQGSARVSKR
jgi:formylglycine-generating enzyme required for sulfatase activity